MYERILIPLDGSALAEGVLTYAGEVAEKFGSEVIIFQAIRPFGQVLAETAVPGDMVMSPTAIQISADAAEDEVDRERVEALEYLDAVCRRFREQGVLARSQVVEGAAGAAILDYAKDAEVSLIAMSTHGRGGLKRLVFGSIADEVLRNAHVPLLLIHPDDLSEEALPSGPEALAGEELPEPIDLAG